MNDATFIHSTITQTTELLSIDSDNLQTAIRACTAYIDGGALRNDITLRYLIGQIQLHSLEVENSAHTVIEMLN